MNIISENTNIIQSDNPTRHTGIFGRNTLIGFQYEIGGIENFLPCLVELTQTTNQFIFLCLKPAFDEDRKSTRLNSSHVRISYAVFGLKKKSLTTLLNIRF